VAKSPKRRKVSEMHGMASKAKKAIKKGSGKLFKQTGTVKATANRIKKACSPTRLKP
jgi:hypothetical protein